MKTIKLLGLALMTVLLSVSLSSCSKSDDENGGDSSASIEGTWFLKSEIWYDWNVTANKPKSTPSYSENYGDYAEEMTWVLSKDGDNLRCKEVYEDGVSDTDIFYHVSGNEYYTMREEDHKKFDRIIFKSVSDKQMVVEYYDGYYTDEPDEMGVLTFMR